MPIFECSPSYNMVVVIQPDLPDPFNDCTPAHINQGFSWREGSVSFYHPDAISCLIEVLISDEPSVIAGEPQRVLMVPFMSKGSIEFGDMFSPKSLALPAGKYQISYELFPGVGEDSDGEPFDFNIRIRFTADPAPVFSVVKQDSDMNFSGEIIKDARPA